MRALLQQRAVALAGGGASRIPRRVTANQTYKRHLRRLLPPLLYFLQQRELARPGLVVAPNVAVSLPLDKCSQGRESRRVPTSYCNRFNGAYCWRLLCEVGTTTAPISYESDEQQVVFQKVPTIRRVGLLYL